MTDTNLSFSVVKTAARRCGATNAVRPIKAVEEAALVAMQLNTKSLIESDAQIGLTILRH
jgi:hypothetical protein